MTNDLKVGGIIFNDDDIIDFHGKKITYREFRNIVDKEDSLVQLWPSGEVITKAECRKRKEA